MADLPAEFADIKGMARVYFSRHSCDADLGVAEAYLEDARRWNATKRDSLDNAKGALLQSAVIHYARAFDPASRHRSHIDIERHLNPSASEMHNLLIDLRHESLAHFGPAGDEETPWSEDIPAILIDGKNWQTLIASRRSLYRYELVNRFLNHLKIVRPIVTKLSEQSKEKFSKTFEKYWLEDSNFQYLLIQNEMDPVRLGGWNGPILSGDRSGRKIQVLSDKHFKK
jgi:hypothetical protein